MTLDVLTAQDRMKGGPTELLRIELEVAREAFAQGEERARALLTPTPGWTLPAPTRTRLQQREHFAVRTVVTVHAGGSIDDYYGTDRGPDPYLPGEVAD